MTHFFKLDSEKHLEAAVLFVVLVIVLSQAVFGRGEPMPRCTAQFPIRPAPRFQEPQ